MVCRALMAKADGLACITTNAYALDDEGYISELYELAHVDCPPKIEHHLAPHGRGWCSQIQTYA